MGGNDGTDRGLVQKVDATGKPVWHVRLYHEGQERRFGGFASKTAAREFYEKAKLEQNEGRFFPERYHKGGSELVASCIDRYLTTIGQKKSQRDERRFGAWWKARFREQRLQAITPAALEEAKHALLAERTAPHLVKGMRSDRHLKLPRQLQGAH